MVLHRDEIKKRLGLPASNARSLVVTPLIEADGAIDEDSIDLRLGTQFLISRTDRLAANVPGHSRSEYYRAVHVPLGRYLVLPGHQTVLAATLEFIKLPADVSGMVLTKSSWARTFITVESAPWIHPCYRGCLTLEIANVSETPIVLHPGLPIAQLILVRVQQSTRNSKLEDRITGTYVGPIRPEPAALKDPRDALSSSLGLRRENVRMPWDEDEVRKKL